MVKEGVEKESRGWKYKELKLVVEETAEGLDDKVISDGIQISIFD